MKKLLFLFLLIPFLGVAQNNIAIKGMMSLNTTDTAAIQNYRTSLQSSYGNTGGLYYDKTRNKWRIWKGVCPDTSFHHGCWVDLLSNGGTSVSGVQFANNGLSLSGDTVQWGGTFDNRTINLSGNGVNSQVSLTVDGPIKGSSFDISPSNGFLIDAYSETNNLNTHAQFQTDNITFKTSTASGSLVSRLSMDSVGNISMPNTHVFDVASSVNNLGNTGTDFTSSSLASNSNNMRFISYSGQSDASIVLNSDTNQSFAEIDVIGNGSFSVITDISGGVGSNRLKIDSIGNITILPNGDTGTNGQALITDGTGIATWQNVSPTLYFNQGLTKKADSTNVILGGTLTDATLHQITSSTGAGFLWSLGASSNFSTSSVRPTFCTMGTSTTGIAGTYTGVRTGTNTVTVGDISSDGTSLLTVNGSLAVKYKAKSGNYTLDVTDYSIEVTSGTNTQTLPSAVGIAGRSYFITNSGSGTVTVATTSSQTFVNIVATPTTLTLAQFTGVLVQSNGANWIKVSGF